MNSWYSINTRVMLQKTVLDDQRPPGKIRQAFKQINNRLKPQQVLVTC
jgi:hypothetical protein